MEAVGSKLCAANTSGDVLPKANSGAKDELGRV